MTVHLIHVSPERVATTNALAREVPARLAGRHDIRVHHPDTAGVIEPGPGDILIGHPNRYAECLFRRSFRLAGWSRRIVFAPFSHALPADGAAIDDLVTDADLYLAVTGEYWVDTMAASRFSHWEYKTLRCDLGVNRDHFPLVKTRFNPPGKRRFLYIGNADPMKGGDFLARLADANPDIEFGWLFTGDHRHCLDHVLEPRAYKINVQMQASRLVRHPDMNWRGLEGLKLIAAHDVILSCGRSDAIPCETLEAAAWGLVPVTTPQCGYPAGDWIAHIPLDDVTGASAVIRHLHTCPTDALRRRQDAAQNQLAEKYNWALVAEQFCRALECPIPPEPSDPAWHRRRADNRHYLRRYLRCRRAGDAAIMAAHKLLRVPERILGRPAWDAGQ